MSPVETVEFSHQGWRYQIRYHSSVGHVYLWYRPKAQPQYRFGHSKPVTAHRPAKFVVAAMRKYITGRITHAEYNALVPD